MNSTQVWRLLHDAVCSVTVNIIDIAFRFLLTYVPLYFLKFQTAIMPTYGVLNDRILHSEQSDNLVILSKLQVRSISTNYAYL